MKLTITGHIIGQGGHSRVYPGILKCNNTDRGRVIAVKRARFVVVREPGKNKKKVAKITYTTPHPVLRHEACALKKLAGHPSIPQPYVWGSTQYFQYLGLPMLGRNLTQYFDPEYNGPGVGRLTIRNLAAIACQMLDALRYVHSHQIVHRDIKPTNMMFGPNGSSERIYLIDFGICKPFRPGEAVYKPVKDSRFVGTVQYSSVNGHLHIPLAYKDDLESLSYSLFALLLGSLPWNDILECSPEVCASKMKLRGHNLCAGWDVQFGGFHDYCRSLSPDQFPDHQHWISIFKQLAPTSETIPMYDINDASERVGNPKEPALLNPKPMGYLELPDEPADKGTLGHPEDPYVSATSPEVEHGLEEDCVFQEEHKLILSLPQLAKVPEYKIHKSLDRKCPDEVLLPGL